MIIEIAARRARSVLKLMSLLCFVSLFVSPQVSASNNQPPNVQFKEFLAEVPFSATRTQTVTMEGQAPLEMVFALSYEPRKEYSEAIISMDGAGDMKMRMLILHDEGVVYSDVAGFVSKVDTVVPGSLDETDGGLKSSSLKKMGSKTIAGVKTTHYAFSFEADMEGKPLIGRGNLYSDKNKIPYRVDMVMEPADGASGDRIEMVQTLDNVQPGPQDLTKFEPFQATSMGGLKGLMGGLMGDNAPGTAPASGDISDNEDEQGEAVSDVLGRMGQSAGDAAEQAASDELKEKVYQGLRGLFD
ncbi:hypothetical protein BST95_18215 [Halioglobus japonicus]|uniref:DUF4412 domain-containing protein n=1 Tax=Halioglobus japonicus TaxID=930805 RepID=A0AAP8MFV3_9GAMM|nr:hypothetical protein [Halioglobus japonicus]AQA19897.1 hypothetical protein BST95_18215 [Halioglobus japonicus]PLW87027.1 hypothetical protein C0029_00010 [Halioglobus japonicus]GHD10598.1 hypothetical protein GCM10007052_10040 [Halioglobus japonicus]